VTTALGWSAFRKKPVVIAAFQWTGGDTSALEELLGRNWGRADAHDMEWNHEDTEQVVIYNSGTCVGSVSGRSLGHPRDQRRTLPMRAGDLRGYLRTLWQIYPTMKVGYIEHHPTQYRTPLLRALAKEVDLTVFYSSLQGAQLYHDLEFETAFAWDTDILDGYRWEAVWPLDVLWFWRLRAFDAILVHGINEPINWAAFIGAWLWRKRLFLRGEFVRTTWLHRWLFKRVTGILAIGTVAKNAAFAAGVPASKVWMTPYAIDNHTFARRARKRTWRWIIRDRYGWPHDIPIVLFVGKLIPRKRPLDLLAACEGLQCGVLFVGDGPLRPELETEMHQRDVVAAITGFVNQTAMPRQYAAADVLVVPSTHEPFGLVVNEGMACGLPIIASDGVAASVDLVRDNGYVYPAGNAAVLRMFLKVLLGAPALRNSMGVRSKEIIREFSIEAGVKGILKALESTP